MKSITSIGISLAIFMAASCMSQTEKRNMFINRRNSDIGKVLYSVPVPDPISITEINSKQSKYVYHNKRTGCQWLYIVDNETHKIVSWDYVSDPNLCYQHLTIYQ